MIKESLKTSANLLSSGQYFPLRMLLFATDEYAEEVKVLFRGLFAEEVDLLARITTFQTEFAKTSRRKRPNSQPFQEHRAILVYLSLRYPHLYYLYKFRMFRDFVGLVDYPYRPVAGRLENVTQYITLCNLLNEEVRNDNELIQLHQSRLTAKEFPDDTYHILTQDLIYAATFHLPRIENFPELPPAVNRLTKVDREITPQEQQISLTSSFTNFVELERERKKIGDHGELLVLKWEEEKLKNLGLKRLPIHEAVTRGDGLGYDILSYDEKGKDIYIEVKTTTGQAGKPFFVTRNELERSRLNSNQFRLYRLYDFDLESMTANFFEIRGDLSELCINPTIFSVIA
jgi:hypothetical protein